MTWYMSHAAPMDRYRVGRASLSLNADLGSKAVFDDNHWQSVTRAFPQE